MNWLKNTLAGAVAAVALAGPAQAAPINVGGVVWDPDSPLDFSSFSIAIRQFIDPVSGTLSGFGFISTLNGTGQSVFCPGCELTFQFSGYTPAAMGALPTTPGQVIGYTGGTVAVFVDNTPEITNPSDPTTLTPANTGDGATWLSLTGHNLGGTTFTGAVVGIAGQITGLTGVGLLDVIGGLAAANLDTNTQSDGSDLRFSTSFTLLFPAQNPLDAAGTGNFFGSSVSIPEPGTLAMLGLALVGLGAFRRGKSA